MPCFLPFLCLATLAEFEAPAAPFQTTARPHQDEVVNANPPCFVYPAVNATGPYVIEIGASEALNQPTVSLTSPYLLAVPAAPLAPGRYWWRWRPSASTDWSATRAFTVPAEAPVVTFPDVAELARRVGGSHPRVEVAADGLARLRSRYRDQLGAEGLARVEQFARQMRDRELLPEPAFLPPASDPKRTELYQKTFQATRPFMAEMMRLSEDYVLTGEALSGSEAKRRLLHIVGWDPRGSTSLAHNDEPATDVVRHAPLAYDRLYDLLSPAERQRCLDCFAVRMTEMRELWRRRPFEMYPYESHNMGYYLPDMVQACLSLLGDADVEEPLRYCLLQLYSPFYPPYGGADGGWCEGPSYWGWSTGVFARTYGIVQRATGVPVHLRSHVRNMAAYALYGNPPYFAMAPFGDGQENPTNNGQPMALLAALYQDPYARWYAEAKGTRLAGLTSLLFNLDTVAARPPYDLPQGRAFRDVGLAAMHSSLAEASSNVSLLLRSSPFGSISHAYADQNTFTLDAYGEPLLIASGYYQLYGHPHHAEWTRQTAASNSVLVNGEGQPVRDWNARGKLATFRTTAAGDYAVGDAREAYPDKLDRFDRRIVFLRPVHTGGEPLVVIRDELAASRPSSFQFLLHALERMEVDPPGQRVTVARGQARLRAEFLAPAGLAFSQHDRFTQPPFRPAPNQWHLTASTTAPAAGAASLITLQPHRAGGEAGLLAAVAREGQGCTAVTFSQGRRVIHVLFRTDPSAARVELGGLRTDAEAASLTLFDGEVRSAVLFEGTSLEYQGRPLLRSATHAALSGTRSGGRTVLSSDTTPDTKLTAAVGEAASWTQADGPMTFSRGGEESLLLKPLELPGSPPAPFVVKRYEPIQKLCASAKTPGPVRLQQLVAQVSNPGDGPLRVTITAGGASLGRELPPRARGEVALPPVSLGGGIPVELIADEALGGRLVVESISLAPGTGLNLLPNGSFEEVAGGAPVGWSAGSITAGAKASAASAEGGRNGGLCLKLTCLATGGDFGAMLRWPGIAPSAAARRFRMSCWVRTPADAVAGLQVTSRDWAWWQNTERLGDRTQWSEAALEFELPANTDLTHVRLHLRAEQVGSVIYVDDVSLVELPLAGVAGGQ